MCLSARLCLPVYLPVYLSICPHVDRQDPAAVLLHSAASDNLMRCLISTSDFLHRQCMTFNRTPNDILTSPPRCWKLKTNTHTSTRVQGHKHDADLTSPAKHISKFHLLKRIRTEDRAKIYTVVVCFDFFWQNDSNRFPWKCVRIRPSLRKASDSFQVSLQDNQTSRLSSLAGPQGWPTRETRYSPLSGIAYTHWWLSRSRPCLLPISVTHDDKRCLLILMKPWIKVAAQRDLPDVSSLFECLV